MVRDRVVIDEGRARIAGLGMDDFLGERHRLGLVRQGIAQGLHFRRQEAHGIVAAFGQNLAAGDHADAQEIRHRVAAGNHEVDALRHARLIFVGNHGALDHAAGQRLIALAVAADRGELHLVGGDAVFRQRETRQHVGHRIRRRHRDRFSFQVGHRVDVVAHVDAVRQHDPMAADDLDVGAARDRREHTLRAAFEAVDLAGDQRLEADLVVLDLQQIELEALLFGKAAFGRHHEEAGVGLGVEQRVAPGFALRGGGLR